VLQAEDLMTRKRYQGVVDLLSPWLGDNPNADHAWRLVAVAYAQQRQWVQAETAMRQVARLRPGSATAQSEWGTTLRKLGRLAEAERAQRKALTLVPGYDRAEQELQKIEGLRPVPAPSADGMQRAREFVQAQRKRGYLREEIRAQLRGAGWDPAWVVTNWDTCLSSPAPAAANRSSAPQSGQQGATWEVPLQDLGGGPVASPTSAAPSGPPQPPPQASAAPQIVYVTPPAPAPKTLGNAALLCGLLGFLLCGSVSIGGVICGILSYKREGPNAAATVGLVFGIIGTMAWAAVMVFYFLFIYAMESAS